MSQPMTIDRRQERRLEVDIPVYLFPDDGPNSGAILGRLANISASGTCVSVDQPLSRQDSCHIRLLHPSRSVLELDLLSRVVWRQTEPNCSGRHGIVFLKKTQEASWVIGEIIRFGDGGSPKPETIKEDSVLTRSEMQLQVEKRFAAYPQIRESDFETFGKKASAIVKDRSESIRAQVESFFNKDVRQYHEDLSGLFHEVTSEKIESEEIESRLTILTNNLLVNGNALQAIVDKVDMKKIKQLFRELIGCWCYESPIVKMAYEKPRGYPGDYQLFELIYNNKPVAENDTIGFYWDKYFLNNTIE